MHTALTLLNTRQLYFYYKPILTLFFLIFLFITCTCQTNAPLETFSGQMGGRTFSFFFVDLKMPEKIRRKSKNTLLNQQESKFFERFKLSHQCFNKIFPTYNVHDKFLYKTQCVNKPGRKIAPNTGANATKFFTLVTKS